MLSRPPRVLPTIAGLLCLGAFQPASAQDLDPYYLEVKDWVLACDNVGRCEAGALTDGNPAALRLTREAGPNTPTRIRLSLAGATLRAADFRVDGQETALNNVVDWGQPLPRAGGTELTLDGEHGHFVVDLLRNANHLTLGAGPQAASLSLAGMTAVLLAMDAQQGRLDTEGALIRQGPLPESRAPAPRPLPRVPSHPLSTRPVEAGLLDAVRAARGKWVNDACAGTRPEAPRDQAHPLTDQWVLVLLECRREGDLSWYKAFRADRAAPGDPQTATTTMVGNALALQAPGWAAPTLDPATGTLRYGAPAAPDDRCGYRVTQRFDGQFFSLVDYREQRRCAGLPDDWPAWYRSSLAAPE